MIELSLEFKNAFSKAPMAFWLELFSSCFKGHVPERSTSQTAWSRLCDVNVKLH